MGKGLLQVLSVSNHMMNAVRSRYVPVGVVGRPHGVRGEVRVDAHGGLPSGLEGYSRVFIDRGEGIEILDVEKTRIHGRFVLIKISGVDSPEAARSLIGSTLYVERSEMPDLDEGEYYHADVIDCSVEDENGIPMGRVVDVFSTGAHDVLTIRSGSLDWMLPVVSEYVEEVDVVGGVVKTKKTAELRN